MSLHVKLINWNARIEILICFFSVKLPGFIPKSQHYFGKRYAESCINAISDFESSQRQRAPDPVAMATNNSDGSTVRVRERERERERERFIILRLLNIDVCLHKLTAQ